MSGVVPNAFARNGSAPASSCPPAAWACGCSPARAHRSTPPPRAGRLVFGIFAAPAEVERELIRERTPAGNCAASSVSGRWRSTGYVGPKGQLREQGEKVLAT